MSNKLLKRYMQVQWKDCLSAKLMTFWVDIGFIQVFKAWFPIEQKSCDFSSCATSTIVHLQILSYLDSVKNHVPRWQCL